MIGDTTFFIDIANPRLPGHASALSKVREIEARGGRIAMTAITRAELQVGVAQFVRPAEEREAVQGLLAVYPMYPLDGPSADRAGTVFGGLRAKGTPIGILDAMIAAIALERGEELVTRNQREFSRVDGLGVVTY